MAEQSSAESFSDLSADPPVRGFLHRPAAPSGDGLALTHGAGFNCQAPLLVALADAFAGAGFIVLRYNLSFRLARPFGPPRPGEAVRDRQDIRNAISALRQFAPGRIFAGGHSYGGRQATMLCAEEPDLVQGLLLTSYPLHPPGRPEQLRVEHLPKLKSPALFVQGTSDPFGAIAEIEAALKLIPAKTALLPVEDAGHDLGFKGTATHGDLPARVLAEFCRLLA
jgi:hypothetical protein